VRVLLRAFNLQDEEVEFAREYLKDHPSAEYRKVWDPRSVNDYSRGDYKGQGFEDFILSEADKVCMELPSCPHNYMFNCSIAILC
jgi:hypothetical protein